MTLFWLVTGTLDNLTWDTENSKMDRWQLRLRMKAFIRNKDLIDGFRHLNPKATVFTHVGNTSNRPRSWMDRIYISNSLRPNLCSSRVLPSLSDHLIVQCSFSLDTGCQSAYWKFHTQLLTEVGKIHVSSRYVS